MSYESMLYWMRDAIVFAMHLIAVMLCIFWVVVTPILMCWAVRTLVGAVVS